MSTVDNRFFAKVHMTSECWVWVGGRTDCGYGMIWVTDKTKYAHRYAYEQMVGPIPEGLTIDHLCRNRACVRPEHLEPVTNRENSLRGESPNAQNARKTHCLHGHPFDSANTYIRPDGTGRNCKTCHRNRKRAA